MTDTIKMVMYNVADTAVITGSSNISSTLPLSNLQQTQRTKVVRTTDVTQLQITTTFTGVAKPVSAVCLNRHNFSILAQWKVQVFSASGLVYDSGFVGMMKSLPLNQVEWGVDASGASAYDEFLDGDAISVSWFDTVMATSVVITVTDPSNAAGYLQAGRLIIGDAITPLVNPQYGLSSAWEENTKQVRSEGGSLRSDNKSQYKTYNFTLEHLSPQERGAISGAAGYVGLRKDWLISVFPGSEEGVEDRDYTAVVKFTTMPKATMWAYNTYKIPFKLAEA